MESNRAGAGRRDLAVDAAITLAVLASLIVDSQTGEHGSGFSVLGGFALLGATGPLLWRRAHPVAVLIVTTPFVFLLNATLAPYDMVIVVPAVALFSVALYGDRKRSLWIGAAIVPIVVAGVVASGEGAISTITAENLAWVLFAMVAGDALRSRREAAADLTQRMESEQREREAEADRRVAAERLQIAREVHDVVAHSMVAINVQAGTAAHLISTHPEQAEQALREIKNVSGAALADLRATLGLLRDEDAAAPIAPSGRLLQLSELVQPLRATGVDVEVQVTGPAADVPVAVGNAAYRIVQEALTNVIRHAGATRAAVYVGVNGTLLDVEVTDDGDGSVNGHSPGSGSGLRGMRERAAEIGGSVESGFVQGGGWRVHASLPLRDAAS